MAEFVLLAALTALQWARHRMRGVGWVTLSFVILGGLSLIAEIDPALALSQNVAKWLVALLALVPYCLFGFAGTFHRPSPAVRALALVVTTAIIAFTFRLAFLPLPGVPPPPHDMAYRVAFAVAFGFVVTDVVVRLLRTGRGAPVFAASRIRLLALAVAGLEVQIALAALGLDGARVTVASRALAVLMGLLFLAALVLPSLLRVFLSPREDGAFAGAMRELVSATGSRDVAERLLPHVCALVGASEAALLAGDDTVVARYPSWPAEERGGYGSEDSTHVGGRVTVRASLGTTHALAVTISPSMPYFGTEELFELERLARLVGLAIERCATTDQLSFRASHDGLTGLANRALFMERLEEALRHVGRRRSSLCVIFIDLDHFKSVNDHADHATGDVVLREMATRLTTLTRGVDVVARFGGDEFVVFAEVDHEQDAEDVAERIRRGLRQPVDIGDSRVTVTASIGLVVTSDASWTAASLLRHADNAMYEAKRAGRDQIAFSRINAHTVANEKWGLRPVGAPIVSAG